MGDPSESTTRTTTATPLPDNAIIETTLTTPPVDWRQDAWERFTSRKFLLSAAAAVSIVAARIHGDIDGATMAVSLLGALASYLAAEAHVDGERAKSGRM